MSAEMLTGEVVVVRRWVCQVVRSGYHNGSGCGPEEPHGWWGCEYRLEVSLPDTPNNRERLGVPLHPGGTHD